MKKTFPCNSDENFETCSNQFGFHNFGCNHSGSAAGYFSTPYCRFDHGNNENTSLAKSESGVNQTLEMI